MSTFRVEGGTPLNGKIRASGNKNAALPMIAAALLTDQTVIFERVPDIGDVRTMLQLVSSLGADVDWNRETQTLRIRAEKLRDTPPSASLCERVRAGILLAAPMMFRNGHANMPPPGGDVIGRRRLDTHIHGLEALGATVECDDMFRFTLPSGFRGADIFLPEASVTGTEQTLLGAVCAEGRTIIRNAACEPHVQDLCHMLVAMGAQIQGIGSNTLSLDGVDRLSGAQVAVGVDYVEVGSFLALGAATGGNISVEGADSMHLRMVEYVFRRLGVPLEFLDETVTVSEGADRNVVAPIGGGICTVDDGIWPQFPSDLMSVMVVLATQLSGSVLFFEKMYESRMYFIDRLVDMGANAVICDPHRAVITGPSSLHGIRLSSPDIRAGIALLEAALCARGVSHIRNAELIDRGYERIVERIRSLGGRIERIAE